LPLAVLLPLARDAASALPGTPSSSSRASGALARPSKTPSPCPALPIARRSVHKPNRAATSPNRQPRRPQPPADRCARPSGNPSPNRAPKSNPSNPSTEPRPSPTVPNAGPRRNLAGAAPSAPPGTTLQKGISSQGPDCKVVTEIVLVPLLILVNCIENCRKTIKMKTKFCWIRGEKSHNFCYFGLS
jgi:hypothetical protein